MQCRCSRQARVKIPSTGERSCLECFFASVEQRVHETITANRLFSPGDRVCIACSGGKDSTVLIHLMHLLNQRHSYGLQLELLSIDEGIHGYRDDSLETVKRNSQQYSLPLTIVSYEELYGWSMDSIVRQIGNKNNCTFCGVFRRQALDRGSLLLKADQIVTGHNADDIAETVLMNIMRGDLARLERCTLIKTTSSDTIPRSKPFKYVYEKEIVMYAYHKKLDYFSTECIYSPDAFRGHSRTFLKDIELVKPSAILDIIHSGEAFALVQDQDKAPPIGKCTRCGYMSSNDLCKACLLLEGLNRGLPKLGIGNERKVRKQHGFIETETIQHFSELSVTGQIAAPRIANAKSLDF